MAPPATNGETELLALGPVELKVSFANPASSSVTDSPEDIRSIRGRIFVKEAGFDAPRSDLTDA